ncbi:MAG TPA: hypothetical protein VJL58_11180 [Pyrinomonadaceae bacterium]|nr:hypothetical protein [Pyrinomonadaceae bacterium]
MIKKLILLTAAAGIHVGCGSSTAGNNSNKYAEPLPQNANVVANIDANNLPPGMSASPIPPSAESTPGIPDPANANVSPSPGATPTPGIPDPETLKQPVKPGATPTPGIPSPEELRRQLQRSANGMPPSTKGDPTPKKDGKTQGKPE